MERDTTYTIHIDNAWTLEDLYIFPRAYEQVYFAIYSLDTDPDDEDAARIAHAYRVFPWQGGYSAVNFYNTLKYITNKNERPTIRSMRYASPGWIELASLSLNVAFLLEKLVKSVSASLVMYDATYTQLVKGMQERKLLRIPTSHEITQLQGEDLDYIQSSATKMAQIINVGDVHKIDERTGHPYRTLKILLSLYRRIKILADYQQSGKADFNNRQ